MVIEKDRDISWTGCETTEEVLHGVKEEKNVLHKIKKRKANWMVKSCVRTVSQNIFLKARHREG